MLCDILNYDKNDYLRKIVLLKQCKDVDFNNLPSKIKNKIIDNLVDKIKKNGNTKYFIGLVLIFEATIKNVIKLYYPILKYYGYSYDEFMAIIYSNFYIFTKDEFIQKHKKGFKANFNYFIDIKLRNSILKLVNKERARIRINQKYSIFNYDEEFENADINDINENSVVELKDKMYNYYTEILCKDLKKLDIYFDKFGNDITNKQIAKNYNLSKAQISKIIKEVNKDIKVLLKDKNWNLYI